MEEKPNVFYIYLQKKLKECCNMEGVIDTQMAKWKIINMKIPKKLLWLMLDEMEEMKMIKRINRIKFTINAPRKHEEVDAIIANNC